jgi:hypothetical protein
MFKMSSLSLAPKGIYPIPMTTGPWTRVERQEINRDFVEAESNVGQHPEIRRGPGELAYSIAEFG